MNSSLTVSLSTLYPSKLSGYDIRLLQIEPGERESNLRCKLLQTSLDNGSTYYALSYVWGDAKDRKPITCNDCLVEVTANLYAALHEYRERAVPVQLWVDALCINQSNDEERTAQVRMMQSIYKQADMVVIWLGDMYESDELAIDVLKAMNAPWATYEGIPLFVVEDLAAYDLWLSTRLPDQSFSAVGALLQRPWFSRIWIVQELLCARSLSIWCGPQSLDPDVILSGARSAHVLHNVGIRLQLSTTNQSGISRLGITCAGHLETLRQAMKYGTNLGMWELLMVTRYFQSTEPRDKLFALVGLAYDVNEDFVDYSLDLRSIMVKLSEGFLNGETHLPGHPLDMLSCITRLSVRDLESTPSWVVDWTTFSKSLFIPLRSGYSSEKPISRECLNVHFTGDQILHVEGVIVDQTIKLAESPPTMQQLVSTNELMDRKAARSIRDWHLRCRHLVEQLPAYPTGEPTYDAFWRTLVCNRESVGSDNPPKDDTSYCAWTRLIEALATLVRNESWIELARPVGSATLYGLAAAMFARFIRTRSRWWWLLALTSIPLNSVVQRTCTIGLGLYKLRARTKYFQHHNRDQEMQREFEGSFSQWSQGRKFCVTKDGYIGWVPTATSNNDHIVLFKGCRIPFVLRPYEDGYRLLGDCYLHGLMDGLPIHLSSRKILFKIY